MRPNFGLDEIARRARSTNIDEHRPEWDEVGLALGPNTRQHWPDSSTFGLNIGQIWPESTDVRAMRSFALLDLARILSGAGPRHTPKASRELPAVRPPTPPPQGPAASRTRYQMTNTAATRMQVENYAQSLTAQIFRNTHAQYRSTLTQGAPRAGGPSEHMGGGRNRWASMWYAASPNHRVWLV